MGKSGDVFIDKKRMIELIGHIDGYGEAVEELQKYIHRMTTKYDRAAVASVPELAKQWDVLTDWRKGEVKRLAPTFHNTATVLAQILEEYFDEDIKIAARFTDEMLTGDSPVATRLKEKWQVETGRPVEERWVTDTTQGDTTPRAEPAVDPDADYSRAAGARSDG